MLGIVQRFAEEGYEICPEALELIVSYSGSKEDLIERLIRDLDRFTKVISVYDVNKLLSSVYPQEYSQTNLLKSDFFRGLLGSGSTKFTPCDPDCSIFPPDQNGGLWVVLKPNTQNIREVLDGLECSAIPPSKQRVSKKFLIFRKIGLLSLVRLGWAKV